MVPCTFNFWVFLPLVRALFAHNDEVVVAQSEPQGGKEDLDVLWFTGRLLTPLAVAIPFLGGQFFIYTPVKYINLML